jgi:allophanate hydrolase subunit 1
VETDLKIYEFEAKDPSSLAVGDTIQFRVEKDSAYVQRAGKEQEFRVIDTMLKDGD